MSSRIGTLAVVIVLAGAGLATAAAIVGHSIGSPGQPAPISAATPTSVGPGLGAGAPAPASAAQSPNGSIPSASAAQGAHAAAAPAAVLAATPTGIHKIQHVIVIMQENRSFDSYFGTFPGADGIPMANGK